MTQGQKGPSEHNKNGGTSETSGKEDELINLE